MKIYQISKLMLLVLFSLLLIMPVAAQETGEGEDLELGVEMTFTGYISFDADGNVYIDGYFLAPAGVISPSLLEEGQYVEVTGIFLNDDTFKLTGINTEVEEPCDPVTDEDCVEEPIDGEPTGEEPVDEEPTGEEECIPDGQPVAARIADAFDVSACEVEAQHDAGNGFGNIARAYLLAEAYNQALLDGLADGEELDPALLLDAQAYLDMVDSGMGWGQIIKASGVHPPDLAPGKLKKRAANDDDSADTTGDDGTDTTTETSNNGNENGNGNANANANANDGNGNGNSNANANANANNGNGGGNDNANNGNGKDKDKKDKGKKKK